MSRRKLRTGDRVRVTRSCPDLGIDVGAVGRVVWHDSNTVDIAFNDLDVRVAGVAADHSALVAVTGKTGKSGAGGTSDLGKASDKNRLEAEIALLSGDPVSIGTVYGAAAERAFPLAAMKGLKARARRDAEITRSNAIHMERVRCNGLTEGQLRDRLRELIGEG